jgi:hypothetical protein
MFVLVRPSVRLSVLDAVFIVAENSNRMSLGTGRPIVLRDEGSVRHCRILLNHPMSSPTDVRLISQIELIAQKSMSFDV